MISFTSPRPMKFRESVIPKWNNDVLPPRLGDANGCHSGLQLRAFGARLAAFDVFAVLPRIPILEGSHGLTGYSIAASSDCAC